MILGIGSDIVHVDRIAFLIKKHGARFLNRVFTPGEQAYAASVAEPANAYAKRFAAKEAFVKALGTGLRRGIKWKEIEVARSALGRPSITLHGKAKEAIEACFSPLDACTIHLSLSDEKNLAQAFVILEKV